MDRFARGILPTWLLLATQMRQEAMAQHMLASITIDGVRSSSISRDDDGSVLFCRRRAFFSSAKLKEKKERGNVTSAVEKRKVNVTFKGVTRGGFSSRSIVTRGTHAA